MELDEEDDEEGSDSKLIPERVDLCLLFTIAGDCGTEGDDADKVDLSEEVEDVGIPLTMLSKPL